MSLSRLSYLFVFAVVVSISHAFSGVQVGRQPRSALTAHVSRRAVWDMVWDSTAICTTAAAAAAVFPIPAAHAADDTLKGTKKDPAYESCLSDCMFYCTKPKGSEQKSRGECLPECKVKCATTKEQLLKGMPLKK